MGRQAAALDAVGLAPPGSGRLQADRRISAEVQAFVVDALWKAGDVIQQARHECGPLPETATLTPQDAHRLRVGCSGAGRGPARSPVAAGGRSAVE